MPYNSYSNSKKNFHNKKFLTLLNENNFYNFHKNNIKMNKAKKSAEKTSDPHETTVNDSHSEHKVENRNFKMTQYPIVPKSQTSKSIINHLNLVGELFPFLDKNKFVIFEQNLNQAEIETETERKMKMKKKIKNFKNLEKPHIQKKENETNSEKKGATHKKLFFKHGLFNRSSETEQDYVDTVDSYTRYSNKELQAEIQAKHNVIVEKIKKKNLYEPINKLPYICLKSGNGQEGTVSLNYKKELSQKPEVKKNNFKLIHKRYSQAKTNVNMDGEALFNRIFEKNFKITKNFCGLNL